MAMINFKTVFTVGKKEFLDNVRNRWFLVLSIIMFLIVVIWAFVAPLQEVTNPYLTEEIGIWQNAIFGMLGITALLIPLIAVILGFNTIAGEAESGSLYVVLSYPVTRLEVLIGKYIGLGSVIALSTIIGFGAGGIILIYQIGTKYVFEYFLFICLTIFLGLIFLSLTICISAMVKRRIHAIGGGIVVFFWGMIIGIIMMGVLISMGYNFNDMANWPNWFWNVSYLSPADLSQATSQMAFGWDSFTNPMDGQLITMPDSLSMINLMAAHALWFFVPFILSCFFFKRRDI